MQTNNLIGHTKGVFSLSYNDEHRFIVSAGFDHEGERASLLGKTIILPFGEDEHTRDEVREMATEKYLATFITKLTHSIRLAPSSLGAAFIWSPFVNSLLFKLSGHSSSLVGCHCVEGTNELITADNSGMFKIWDLRNFMCVQTFTSVHEQGDLNDLSGMNSFTHVKLPSGGGNILFNPDDDEDDFRIICGTKRLFFFDQFRAKKEPVTDHLPITVALFNEVSLTIMTVAGKGVKIWDAVMGNVKIERNELNDCDISCACLDDRRRKFFIGDVNGQIKAYNFSNFALMKKFPNMVEGPTVTDLIYCSHVKVLLASGSNGCIRIYDELDPETCIVLRNFDEGYRHQTLQSIVYCHGAGTVCSAGVEEVLKVWDFETGKCLNEFSHVENKKGGGNNSDGDSDEQSEMSSRPNSNSGRNSSRKGSRRGSGESMRRRSRGENSKLGDMGIELGVADSVEVVAMKCLEDYPLIAISTSDGKVAIYGMRHAHSRIRNTCVLRFENKPPIGASYNGENNEEVSDILCNLNLT